MPDVQKFIGAKPLLRSCSAGVGCALAAVWSGAVRWVSAAMLLLAAQAHGVTLSDLYSASVTLQGSGPAALAASYSSGLGQVLVRVAGSRDVLQRPGITEVLGKAESMLASYQILNAGVESRVQMNFGAVAVTQALASVQAPVWGANRPLTLVWVALEERGERALITADDAVDGASAEFRASLENASRARGVPLVLPAVSAAANPELLSHIWGQFVGRVRSASNNVSRDLMVLVRVSRSAGQWRAGWVMDGFNADNTGEQAASADSLTTLAATLVDRWAELYASRYAVSGNQAGKQPAVDLVLQGIANLADYAEVTRALAKLDAVDSVVPVKIKNSELTMRLAFSGELNQLREYLALDARLVQQSVAAGASEEQALRALYPVLIYRWQPSPVAAMPR